MKRETVNRRPRSALTAQPVPLISHRRAGNEFRAWLDEFDMHLGWYLRSPMPAWIYFASFRSGAVKVGLSQDPISRIRVLGAGRHGPAQPLVLIADGCLADERIVLSGIRLVAELIGGKELFAFSLHIARLVNRLRAAAEASFFDNSGAPYARTERHCSRCSETGHNNRNCPTRQQKAA